MENSIFIYTFIHCTVLSVPSIACVRCAHTHTDTSRPVPIGVHKFEFQPNLLFIKRKKGGWYTLHMIISSVRKDAWTLDIGRSTITL